MRIPFITEPVYSSASIWYAETREGIGAALSRKKYTAADIDGSDYRAYDYDALFSHGEPRMAVVIGTSPSWVPEVTAFLRARGIDVILVSYQPSDTMPVRGTVLMDYAAGVRTLLTHLRSCGCRRAALYGCFENSSADRIKRQAFKEAAVPLGLIQSKNDCFDNSDGLAGCYAAFRGHAHEFDAVLCVNDMAAASLIRRLRADGIRVPEDVQVACFGGSEIARLGDPPITALINDNAALGTQAVELYAYLTRAGGSVNVSVRVEGRLVVRGSTRPCGESAAPLRSVGGVTAAPSFYADDEVRAFSFIENLLSELDAVDLAILGGLLSNLTGERIAESLGLAPETVRYRIRRIVQTTDAASRAELIEKIRRNPFGYVIEK